ncbi:phosphoadenosine phosphosulfate reductase family protein [Sandarakinorhabdus sp. DWP1-3-1]|uniref:phosphoadenosine phosphosulfate reductase domain-containing protein n=1 Tax=Sandarakinorhabdus sp. DWP1-3-1 TaxID=2804627 RepID=UPI003CF8A2CA
MTGSLFSGGARMLGTEAIELTLMSLRAYWDKHDHVAVAWSGGKDSTATLTMIIHLIDAGELPQPQRLWVFYADTRQELPPIAAAAELMMAKLRLRNWITVEVVRAPMDKRFMVYMLGRGVPPPNNNTLRWCTRQIKVDPMTAAIERALEHIPGTVLMITGVREGESAVRDGRISMSCSKDGAECGQGWYQQVLPMAKGIRGRVATLAPILHWRVCTVWDWLMIYAPQPEFGGWDTRILADAYGGDEAVEVNARTGCIACPLAAEDVALKTVVAMPAWTWLAPLLQLRPVYRSLRLMKNRLRKAEPEVLKDGTLSKSGQRAGPVKLDVRLEALEKVLAIQKTCNDARPETAPALDILNVEEESRIRELIAAKTWPQRWDGSEVSADAWLDKINADGTVEPIMFRELVGS